VLDLLVIYGLIIRIRDWIVILF